MEAAGRSFQIFISFFCLEHSGTFITNTQDMIFCMCALPIMCHESISIKEKLKNITKQTSQQLKPHMQKPFMIYRFTNTPGFLIPPEIIKF